jgi:hypothetical protein
VTLSAGQTCTITYGSKAGGGNGAAAPTTTGAYTFTGSEASTSSGTPSPLASSAAVTIYAPNGSGTMPVSPTTLSAASTGDTLTFTYTAATGGLLNGEVEVAVPGGWQDAPSTSPTSGGYATSTCGTLLSIAGRTITTVGVTLPLEDVHGHLRVQGRRRRRRDSPLGDYHLYLPGIGGFDAGDAQGACKLTDGHHHLTRRDRDLSRRSQASVSRPAPSQVGSHLGHDPGFSTTT